LAFGRELLISDLNLSCDRPALPQGTLHECEFLSDSLRTKPGPDILAEGAEKTLEPMWADGIGDHRGLGFVTA
jgi:hypothetical protein